MDERKKNHIDLALNSQTLREMLDDRFDYEPLLSPHPAGPPEPFDFLGKKLNIPFWVWLTIFWTMNRKYYAGN